MQLKTFTIADIRSWRPCYNPARHLSGAFKGTALDIAMNEAIPMQDVLWVVMRDEVLSQDFMRRFAVWCAAEALFVANQTDARCWNACDVALRFAEGRATLGELSAAESAARSAAWSAAWSAAESAAWSAQRKKLISMLKGESSFTLSNLRDDYPIVREVKVNDNARN